MKKWKELVERKDIIDAKVEISKRGEVKKGILNSIIFGSKSAILKITQSNIIEWSIPFEFKPNDIGEGRIQIMIPAGMVYIYPKR